MEKQELIDRVNSVLAEEFEAEVDALKPEAGIKDTLQLDSLSLVDMVALIENEFGVKIPSSEVGKILTFAQLYDYIYERSAK